MSIKAIGFDQGGILVDVDYDKTVAAFRKLGAINAHKIYTQASQADYVDAFERGKIDAVTFRKLLRKDLRGLRAEVTDDDIDFAWNAMILDFSREKLIVAKELKNAGYITFMFSNIDAIRYASTVRTCHRNKVEDLLESAFHEKYFSHIFGHNKPCANSFRLVAKDLNLKYGVAAEEILFIDDSKKHIFCRANHEDKGALCAGWKGLLVPQNLTAKELKKKILDIK